MIRSKVARRRSQVPTWSPQYPYAVERSYSAHLSRFVNAIDRLLRERFVTVYAQALAERNSLRRDAWPEDLETGLAWLQFNVPLDAALKAMRRTAEAAKNFGGPAYAAFARAYAGVAAIQSEPKLEPLMDAWSKTNSKLIKSIQTKYLDDVAASASEYVRMGRTSKEFAEELRRQHDLAVARAKLIARTETAKLNSAITRERQEALGLNTYVWRSSRDERVRASHRAMEGMYCKYSDSSVCSRDGVNWVSRASIGGYIGDPGTDYQCRCTASADVMSVIDAL